MESKKKWHWYCLSYVGSYEDSREEAHAQAYASIYSGFSSKYVTKASIYKNRKDAGLKDGVLISCSYLGKMTKEEFTADTEATTPERTELLVMLKDATARIEEIEETDCLCDNTHIQNNTKCCLCEYKEAIAKAEGEDNGDACDADQGVD